ncbi:MAG: BMP family ABC transporter substrate-binding protein [Synergistaceae bacterium]|jgi:basic membrane protein A|nr:BMP family ABC transporter substrate-binding protein [Synergistaceae bacterium]
MKKMFIVVILLAAFVMCLSGAVFAAENGYKACLVTSTPRGNEFTDLIWSGFLKLEKEGWEVKCIETFETAEHAEQIRSMCAEGYNLVYTQGDDVMTTVKDIYDELHDAYPGTVFIFLDTYAKTELANTSAVTIDPFEACFIAGYVAAGKSKSGEIGLMMPLDTPIMRRFEFGYYAGIDYANVQNGTQAKMIKAYTNDWADTTKGYESTIALISSHPNMDVVVQCAYISGYGAISACVDKKIPCIGVDDWQGDIDPIVFWSAIKSMDIAVYETAKMWINGNKLPFALEFDLEAGGLAYADVDLKNLAPEQARKVVQLKNDIMTRKVDVFAGKYEEWRETNFDQSE